MVNIRRERGVFELASIALQNAIDAAHADGFHPNNLTQAELRNFQNLYDQAETMIDKLLEIEDMLEQEDEDREAMEEEIAELRQEEYEMHKAIVGNNRADEDFFFSPNDGD